MKTATKKHFIILCFCIFFMASVAAQESVKITYTVEQRVNFDSIKSAEVGGAFMLVNEVISGFEFELLINENGKSIFRKTEPMIEDYSQIELYRLALGFSAGDEIWYTEKENPEKSIYKNDFENGPLLLALKENVTWVISDETKRIGEYKAKKASTTRKIGSFVEQIEVWFTSELSYSIGPLGYNGLPGLILELKRDKVFYKFKKLEKIPISIEPPKASKQMSFDEYYLMLESRVAEIKKRGY
ncbi:GLPGLI family protein [Flagellimonas zhangzhouensis]|uniref:GLPGLI family protein n=1 Tax=Flagellimonas zhangzhouensis TaxID=1073328 RepID=A0A1H2S6E2_9FLAO|nr:GLPGLI family protein [Allomuricauda zhangzhouensis]SDQ71259.1 GLPGLI family protein [Allomuricauda zhangzhouensis]SDW27217.1 GLPGLI family protein [Allomuricauda zhangzhouensis]